MTTRALKSAVQHPVRLDMLDCLDRKIRTVDDVSEKIGVEARLVAHHMTILLGFGLVAEKNERDESKPLYTACLKSHPAWVTREVNVRRRAKANRA